jgi:uncharacterized iron-regulated protein
MRRHARRLPPRLPGLLVTLSVLAGLAVPAMARAHPLDGTIWDMVAGDPIDRETLAERLAAADIVILGEVHDNPGHHLAQAWVVGRLRPPGLAFEMIPRASEGGIAALLEQGGMPAEIGPAIGWERAGWPDWDLYRPVFEAWRARVYTGGALPRRALDEAAAAGAASVVTDRRFAPALARPLDPAMQAAVEDEMVAAHCDRLPRNAAPGMVEVQRLRDASFASAALRARATGGGQVMLITGNGHARTDRGVPVYLREVAPELAVVAVGMIETDPQAPSLDDYRPLPYDYVWFTAPAERPDPCDAFK